MGYYINPKDGSSKESWLREHGERISADAALAVHDTEDHLPVCLVDNGGFTAAGIGYDRRETEAFLAPDSGRQRLRIWYKVAREKLEPYL